MQRNRGEKMKKEIIELQDRAVSSLLYSAKNGQKNIIFKAPTVS